MKSPSLFYLAALGGCFLGILWSCSPVSEPEAPIQEEVAYTVYPQIDGDWWTIAGNPDLGEYTSDRQQPVDFGIWQAADGTWQLWSCIRHTNCGGNTRLFHGWEGQSLTDTNWKPLGIMMEGDTTLGERQGGMQAPHVIVKDSIYHMLYGSWDNICLATSVDGKNFRKVIQNHGGTSMFRGPMENTRDAMTIQIDDLYYTYYVGHNRESSNANMKAAIFCRTSPDLMEWSDPILVSGGGSVADFDTWGGGDAECPFVVKVEDQYILFRNQIYGHNQINTQYISDDPLDFGVNNDDKLVGMLEVAAPEIVEYDGQYYMVALLPGLDGIRMAKLKFVKVPKDTANQQRLAGIFGDIPAWNLIGPFPNEDGNGLDSIFPPERGIDLTGRYPGLFYQQVSWKTYQPKFHSLIDLDAVYPGIQDGVAYAHVRVWSPDERNTRLLFADDDAVKIWLNEERVHWHHVPKGQYPQNDYCEGRLRSGWNDLLIKMSDPKMSWRYYFRFHDPNNELKYAL